MSLKNYLESIRGKTIAVIGIGISNTPLIELLLDAGFSVTACDKRERNQFDAALLADAAGSGDILADGIRQPPHLSETDRQIAAEHRFLFPIIRALLPGPLIDAVELQKDARRLPIAFFPQETESRIV